MFARNTDRRFDEVDRRFDRVDIEIRDLHAVMNARLDRIDARFDALQWMMLQVGGGMIVTFVIGFAGLIVAQA